MALKEMLKEIIFCGLFLFLACGCGPVRIDALAPDKANDPVMTERILRATVLIRIVAPHVDESGNRLYLSENGQEIPLNIISSGLGTLVQTGAGSLIITTDHYGQLQASAAEVTITDVDGNQIALSIDAFRSLIRYQDYEVVIMIAPPGLPPGVEAGDGEKAIPGSAVYIVHRQPRNDTLSVVPAVVEAWIDYQGTPSFQLRNLRGELIEPGNSGGSVWYHQRPVGSIHRTILVDESGEIIKPEAITGRPSHLSYATRLSPVRMAILNQGIPIAEVTE